MYVEIQTNNLTGIFRVVEILGNIIAVDNNGTTYDCYINSKEIKRFCTKDGKNYTQKF